MNSRQILDVVNTIPELKQYFVGVFASDTLPVHIGQFPSAFVCNTDVIRDPGSHWIAFWFQSPTASEFYDSFGRLPENYSPSLRDFIDRNSVFCVYNNIQVQPEDTSTCGYHVLFYLYLRSKGYSMTNVLNILRDLPSDVIVRDYIRNII